MPTSRQNLGRWGEALAADYLTERGYIILERNARTRYGEIDIVAQLQQPSISQPGLPDETVTVFVEVKTRATRTYGAPEESVNARKQAHMLAAAQAYLQAHPEVEGVWRIDVLAIQRIDPRQEPLILHFENALNGP